MQLFNSQPGAAAPNLRAAFEDFPDEKLYELCRLYGEQTLAARRKFAGLLPEVFKRRLYEKKGFSSIYEFAAKLAGMTERQVDVVLNLEKKFESAPILKQMLEHGEISANKLARIASVSTVENQEFWADQARILPQRALETLVRDSTQPQKENLPKWLFDEDVMRVHHSENKGQILQLSQEVEERLIELQNKGIDINALLLEFLEERELKIAQEKEKLSIEAQPSQSRYIPVATRKLLKKEYGEKCSIKTCIKPAQTIHHLQRFALSKIHDPKYLALLCQNHHAIAHSIDMKFHEKRAQGT